MATENHTAHSAMKETSEGPLPPTGVLSLGTLADSVGFHLRVAQVAAFRAFEGQLTRLGVAPRYLGLLMLIEANPGAPQSRLAEAIHLDRSSLVPVLDKLEAEGLVERRSSSADRRLKSVWLTAEGTQQLAKLKPLVTKHEEKLVEGFTAQEQAQLVSMLKRMRENLQQRS